MGCDMEIRMEMDMDMDMRGPSGVKSSGSSRELGLAHRKVTVSLLQLRQTSRRSAQATASKAIIQTLEYHLLNLSEQ
jgi:hypothetical protein